MRQGCLKDYFPHTESQLFLASPMLLGRAGVPGREGVTGGLASLVRALLRTPSSRRTNRASSPYKTPARSHNCIQQHTLVYLSLSSTQAVIHDLVSSPSIKITSLQIGCLGVWHVCKMHVAKHGQMTSTYSSPVFQQLLQL
jgi:hypothetical protein